MSALNPTKNEKQALQELYVACRALLKGEVSGKIFVQKSFEEMMYGFLGEYAWRPTHASLEALKEVAQGNCKNVQRAHGIVENRLDRYDRTMKILLDEEQPFDSWWTFYRIHDSTILITKNEHSTCKKFKLDELIELPNPESGMFVSSGFSFRMRKKLEVQWAKLTLEKLQCHGTTEL
jgi:hypothetical protein